MANSFYPYPVSLPTTEVAQLVIDAIQLRIVDPKETSHAVWHMIGYALGMWDTHPKAMESSMEAAGEVFTEEKAVEYLSEMTSGGEGMRGVKATVIPWGLLLPLLVQLLQKLLTK